MPHYESEAWYSSTCFASTLIVLLHLGVCLPASIPEAPGGAAAAAAAHESFLDQLMSDVQVEQTPEKMVWQQRRSWTGTLVAMSTISAA